MKQFLNSTVGKLVFAGGVLFLLLLILSALKNDQKPTSFREMNELQRTVWLRRELQNSVALNRVLVNRIKSQFKYPEEVKFESDEDMITFNAKIEDPNTGLCFNNGDLIAKNDFGIKSKYYWQVKFTLTDSSKNLIDLSVLPY
jgi:hypothetical protein